MSKTGVKRGQYINVCVNDRGFTSRPPQLSYGVFPTLRAQTHGNPPKVIQIAESEGNNAEIRNNKND